MSLFDASELPEVMIAEPVRKARGAAAPKKEKAAADPADLSVRGGLRLSSGTADRFTWVTAKTLARCSAALADLRPGEVRHVVTAAGWSMHELLAVLVQQYGRFAGLWFSSYSMAEDACRWLVTAKQEGKLGEVHGVVDRRVCRLHPAGFVYAKQHLDSLNNASLHAKAFALIGDGDTPSICLTSSANLTKNPRIELTVIQVDPVVCDFHRRWIDEVRAHKNAYIGEGLELSDEIEPEAETIETRTGITVAPGAASVPVERTLVLMQGIPGSGKSVISEALAAWFAARGVPAVVRSPDKLRAISGAIDDEDQYRFRAQKAALEARAVADAAIKDMDVGVPVVIVDATHRQAAWAERVTEAAVARGYEIQVVRSDVDPLVALRRDRTRGAMERGIGLDDLRAMRAELEDLL